MPNSQGFSNKDIEALRKPNDCQASRTSPRMQAESALPASVHAANDAAPAPVPDMQASVVGDGYTDLIQEESDKVLTTFSSKRKLLIDLGKDSFYEHAWKVKCMNTILHDGGVYVTLESALRAGCQSMARNSLFTMSNPIPSSLLRQNRS
jgi:hypothetical protein